MKRFGVAATQGKRADILWIKRLPANRDLRLLRVILCCAPPAETGSLETVRGVLAEPLLALGKVNLEAVEAGEVPVGLVNGTRTSS